MEPTPYLKALWAVQKLSATEQLRLIAAVAGRLQHRVEELPPTDITKAEGLGKEVWEGVDVEQYLKEERSSWER